MSETPNCPICGSMTFELVRDELYCLECDYLVAMMVDGEWQYGADDEED